MKIGRSREHKVQPRQYEMVTVRAWVEFDTETDELPPEFDSWHAYGDKHLDDALAEEVVRAIDSATQDTHLSLFYPE